MGTTSFFRSKVLDWDSETEQKNLDLNRTYWSYVKMLSWVNQSFQMGLMLTVISLSSFALANDVLSGPEQKKEQSLSQICFEDLKKFPGKFDEKLVKKACQSVHQENDCKSVKGHPICHYDRSSKEAGAKKILVFSMIHGDETPAGSVGRFWMQRLADMDPRNTWRVVPVLNPDGVAVKTRTNANKVDLNRNFPTQDWDREAIGFWKKSTSSNPRRFPGMEGGSEPETKCALHHMEEFKPDFIVSIHTPLKVLDYDGPKVSPPKYDYLPWKSLGISQEALGATCGLKERFRF